MANEKNLEKGINTQFRSGEEAARSGRKGGIASGKARNLKACLLEAMEKGGYEKMTEVAMANLDNPRFWELIRDTIGEKPKEQISLETEVIRIGFDDDAAEV